MRDLNSGIWARKQTLERRWLKPIVASAAFADAGTAEPGFSERLCKIIVAYWAQQGRAVKAWVEIERHHVKSSQAPTSIYSIRTEGIPVRGA